jgi:hypothetical protein
VNANENSRPSLTSANANYENSGGEKAALMVTVVSQIATFALRYLCSTKGLGVLQDELDEARALLEEHVEALQQMKDENEVLKEEKVCPFRHQTYEGLMTLARTTSSINSIVHNSNLKRNKAQLAICARRVHHPWLMRRHSRISTRCGTDLQQRRSSFRLRFVCCHILCVVISDACV